LPPAMSAIIPAGTRFAVTTTAKACTNTHKVGDRVLATVTEPVEGGLIPAGATVAMEVTESRVGKNDSKAVRFHLKPVSVTFGGNTYPLDSTTVDSVPLKLDRRQ